MVASPTPNPPLSGLGTARLPGWISGRVQRVQEEKEKNFVWKVNRPRTISFLTTEALYVCSFAPQAVSLGTEIQLSVGSSSHEWSRVTRGAGRRSVATRAPTT